MALAALTRGRGWVDSHIASLSANRAAVAGALSPLEAAAAAGGAARAVFGGEGAIYMWARLPPGFEAADEAVVAWLIARHKARVG